MQKWSLLPTEIINQIIIYVDENYDLQERRNDLSQCALSCRSWKEIAQPLLFSKLTLKNFEISSEILLRLMMNNSKLGAYVKELYSWNEIKLASLITIDFLFPNLDKIKLKWDDVSYSFFCKLITKEGKFRNLTTIPFDIHYPNMYVECLFTLKSQITEVRLDDNNDEEHCTYLKLCDELYQFPNLQSVCIYQTLNVSSRNIMDYVEAITVHDNLMYLKELELRVSPHNQLCLPFKELCDVQPSAKIKVIDILVYSFQSFVCINEQFMLYIMKKFPNPNQIYFQVNDSMEPHRIIRLNQGYIQQPTTTVLHFLQYLCKIQDCDALNILYVENAAGIIKDLLSTMNLQTKIKLPQIYITVIDYGTQDTSPKETAIGVNNDAVDDTRAIFIELSTSHTARFEQRLLNLFQEAGCFFTEATLKMNTIGELISGLNHIGKYCDKLKKLEIEGDDLLEDSLAVLEKVSDEAKNYSVKKLCISVFGLTPNQLRFILAYFPCLENLILHNFFSIGNENGQAFSTLLDNTLLKYMQIKTDGIANFSGLSGIHINLTTDAGQNGSISLSVKGGVPFVDRTYRHFVPLIGYDYKILDSDKDTNWVNWQIHCKSIEKVDIVFPTIVTTGSGRKREVPQTITLSF